MFWGSGLFRYITDAEAEAMRRAVVAACDDIDLGVWEDIESRRIREEHLEGQRTTRLVSYYEPNPSLRTPAIAVHDTVSQACGFHFEQVYGERGEGYIEAHHRKPVSEYTGDEVVVDPEEDMAVVCGDCHQMIHRRQDDPLTVDELREVLRQRGVLAD